jgi:hypothetical protein
MANNKSNIPSGLIAERASQCNRHVSSDFHVLADAIKSKFGDSLDGILLYGSCLCTHSVQDAVVDLYIVVNNYRDAYGDSYLRHLNAIIPPNVFYIEVDNGEQTIHAKYAVLSHEDLLNGASKWFNPYIWARFAQPVRMLYGRNEETRESIYEILSLAVLKLLGNSLPAMESKTANAEDIWVNALTLTYQTELRLEDRNRSRYLVHQNMGDYTRLTEASVEAFPDLLQPLSHGLYKCITTDSGRKQSRRRWRLRNWQGSVLTVIRLMKATFTFNDCIDYAVWKIHRHTGISIQATPELKRHPILYGFNIFWRLLRRGILH